MSTRSTSYFNYSPNYSNEGWYSYLTGDHTYSYSTPRANRYLYPTWGSYMKSFVGIYPTSDYSAHYHNSLNMPTYAFSASDPYQTWGEWMFGSKKDNYSYSYGNYNNNLNNMNMSNMNQIINKGSPFLQQNHPLNTGLHDYPGGIFNGGRIATSPYYSGAGTPAAKIFDSSYTHPSLRFRGRESERERERMQRQRAYNIRFYQNIVEELLQIIGFILVVGGILWLGFIVGKGIGGVFVMVFGSSGYNYGNQIQGGMEGYNNQIQNGQNWNQNYNYGYNSYNGMQNQQNGNANGNPYYNNYPKSASEPPQSQNNMNDSNGPPGGPNQNQNLSSEYDTQQQQAPQQGFYNSFQNFAKSAYKYGHGGEGKGPTSSPSSNFGNAPLRINGNKSIDSSGYAAAGSGRGGGGGGGSWMGSWR